MADEQAVAPTSVLKVYRKISTVTESESDVQDKEEKKIANLVGNTDFDELKKVADARVKVLESMQEAIDENDSVETVGFKYLAIRTCISQIKSLFNLPEILNEAQREETKRTKG